MSKQIDPTQPLSDFDKRYLEDRLIDPAELGLETTILGEVPDAPEKGLTSDGTARYRAGTVPTDVGQLTLDDEDEEDVPYSEWTNDELRAEVRARNANRAEADLIVPTADKKAQLIAALEADDNAGDEGDDENAS